MEARFRIAVCAGLLIMFQSLTSPSALAQVRDVVSSKGMVFGEDPRRQELAVPLDLAPLALEPTVAYRLRIVYMIPGNRTPQDDAEATLQQFAITMQNWFAGHMELQGYAPKTFRYETEEDGKTPMIHFVYLPQPDTSFHGDYLERWSKVLNAISAEGFPLWQQGDLTLVVAEMHVQEPDGRLRETSAFVGGAGTSYSGVAMVTGETLARLPAKFLTDDRPYGGLVIPAIGPYPLVQNVTFAWFEGPTVSSVSSSAQGAVMHELGHGLNLWHDFRNDSNFNGNLMGNGLRGLRGSLFPERYPADSTRLSPGSALVLSFSRFFASDQLFTDYIPPSAEIRTQGSVVPKKGLCGLPYFAADDSMLGGVLLIRAGQVVAEMDLYGVRFPGTISTYDYLPGAQQEWNILVIDRQGNRTVSAGVPIVCAPGYNRAPSPYIALSKPRVQPNEEVVLDARQSVDPDGSHARLTAQWDLDGDGSFDTAPSALKYGVATYTNPGIYQVVAKLTDERGDTSVSIPIGIRVERHFLPVDLDIKPGDGQNTINPRAHGSVWVAILSDGEFDSRQIDTSTVRFGPGDAGAVRYDTRDFNGDGWIDLALRFDIPKTGIRCGDLQASIVGQTFAGQTIAGTDAIRTVGCKQKQTRSKTGRAIS